MGITSASETPKALPNTANGRVLQTLGVVLPHLPGEIIRAIFTLHSENIARARATKMIEELFPRDCAKLSQSIARNNSSGIVFGAISLSAFLLFL